MSKRPANPRDETSSSDDIPNGRRASRGPADDLVSGRRASRGPADDLVSGRRASRGPADKDRVDVLLVERGLCESRSKAQALVLAGKVFSGETRLDKPGLLVQREAPLRVSEPPRFVSRGGDKLEGALSGWNLDVSGLVCADIGASTGGFTDCLLQRGAARIYAVDVGEHQLAEKLRTDPRVVVMDRTNARFLNADSFSERIQLAVVDASFIGLEKLLPALSAFLDIGAQLLALVKPQFEADRKEAARGRGVIRDARLREQLIAKVRAAVTAHGFEVLAGADSVVGGPKGNLEHFLLAKRL